MTKLLYNTKIHIQIFMEKSNFTGFNFDNIVGGKYYGKGLQGYMCGKYNIFMYRIFGCRGDTYRW